MTAPNTATPANDIQRLDVGNSCMLSIPLDYFGVVTSDIVRRLTAQDSNRGKRKTAMRDMFKFAKLAGLVPDNIDLVGAGLITAADGSLRVIISWRAK